MIKNEVLDVIDKRISLRAYSGQPISSEEENAIVNAAMRAPTAGNQMLYSMIIIRDPKKRLFWQNCVIIRPLRQKRR